MKLLLVCLIIFLSLTGAAYAGDTYSFSVFCSIPVIPGVNAPLITEQTLRDLPATTTGQQNQGTPAITQEPDPKPIQQTSTRDTQPEKDQNKPTSVITIYDR